MKLFFLNLCLFLAASFLTLYFVKKQTHEIPQHAKCIAQTVIQTDPSVPKKTELISIISSQENIPCETETTNLLFQSQKHFGQKTLDEVSQLASVIKAEMESKPVTEEEIAKENMRKEILEKALKEFSINYPRFSISKNPPKDYLYYGIHSGEYKDVKRFLGERVCLNPQLSYANLESSYLGLFFSMNVGREYGGIARILNERIVTLIEGSLNFARNDKYFQNKITPKGHFRTWVHEDLERDYKGWVYQDQRINQVNDFFESYVLLSPWLYNGCNKSIATVGNFCSLDPSFDMEMKEFFYLTDFDIILGNIYCKKSHDSSWKRMATMEFLRI